MENYESFKEFERKHPSIIEDVHVILSESDFFPKGIYISENRYNSGMEINSDVEKQLRKIINEEFEKLFLKNDELINSNRFLKTAFPTKKDINALAKLHNMRNRKPEGISTKRKYLKWLEEE